MALTDAQYVAFLTKAARRLNRKLSLSGINSITIHQSTGEMITPTSPANTVASLEDLLVLQAECLIVQRGVMEALDDGVEGLSVKDGEQTISTNATAALRAKFLESASASPCEELLMAIRDYKYDNNSGKMVW